MFRWQVLVRQHHQRHTTTSIFADTDCTITKIEPTEFELDPEPEPEPEPDSSPAASATTVTESLKMSLVGTSNTSASDSTLTTDSFQSALGHTTIAVSDISHAFVPSHTPHASTLPLTQHCPDGGSELEQHAPNTSTTTPLPPHTPHASTASSAPQH